MSTGRGQLYFAAIIVLVGAIFGILIELPAIFALAPLVLLVIAFGSLTIEIM